MSTAVVSVFFGLLTLVVFAATVTVLGVLAATRGARATRGAQARAWLRRHALGAAAAVTATATLGSLYYSEVAGYPPCALCWYQRIFAYPLAVILAVAVAGHLWRSRDGVVAPPPGAVWASAVPLAALGLPISVYHIAVQRLPDLDSAACTVGVPCSAIYVQQFGFVTIPVMAMATFVFTLTCAAAARPERAVEPDTADRG